MSRSTHVRIQGTIPPPRRPAAITSDTGGGRSGGVEGEQQDLEQTQRRSTATQNPDESVQAALRSVSQPKRALLRWVHSQIERGTLKAGSKAIIGKPSGG